MDKQIISSTQLDEQYTIVHHPSGLDIMMWKKEGFSTVEALFGTKYGSINNCFKTDAAEDFIKVPDGIAHYLEHKLFESDDNSSVFDQYAQTGASANAFTSTDITAYLFSCTDNYEQSLEILLDFVQSPYFTKENVDKEQGIIAQEIKMGDDSPTRKCFKNLLKALYKNNPVRIDVAGTVESIAEITPELLYQCYNAFYNLHNMTLSIAGNIDEQTVLNICDKKLKPSRDMHLETQFPEEPDEVCESRVCDSASVGLPVFCIGFKTQSPAGIEYVKKSVIAAMLLEQLIGQTSPLYNSLLEEGLINSALGTFVYTSSERYFCCIIEGESKDPDEVARRIFAEIERLKTEGLDKEAFETDKRVRYGEKVSSINDVKACADAMLYYHFDCGDVTLFDDLDIIASLTAKECEDMIDDLFSVQRSSISIVQSKE